MLVADRILSKPEQMQIAEEVARKTGFHFNGAKRARPAKSVIWRDLAWVLGGAFAATAAICLWNSEPPLLTLVMAVVLVAFVIRWGTTKDLVGLAVGATLGNLTEILCDIAGVWRHASAQFLGVTPAYILLCYPILGIAIPRMIDAVVGRGRPWKEGQGSVLSWAMLIFGAHVALCLQFAQQNSYLMVSTLICLGAFVWRFRSAHDRTTLLVGAAMGLLWELPCTYWGAWSFPNPQLFGLIPLWLPIAYAVFFGAIGRITSAALVRCTESRVAPQTSPAQIEPALNGELS